MGRKTLEESLKTFGLTDKETEIYIHLAKRGTQKTSQIAKALRANKGLVYRILKNLEQKGLVEVTLESPTRYVVVPFEKIIDIYVQSRREEADRIENAKDDLLSDWKKIDNKKPRPYQERFSVIEDEKKIFNKISQMVNDTQEELVSIITINALLKAEKYDILDAVINHPSRSKIKFRYLTNVNKENIFSIKFLLGKLGSVFSLKGKHPDLQDNIFPRLVIRDNEEILLFINDQTQTESSPIDTALCTNCKSIIQSFYGVFEDIWSKSSDIEDVIQEIETGKPPAIMELIKDPYKAKDMYYDSLNKAKNDVLIVTSSRGLLEFEKKIEMVKKWCKNGVSVKIMAPITKENLNFTHKLLEFCEIRHIPSSYKEITIVDNQQFFQLNNPSLTNIEEVNNFQNVFFTNNLEYIKETKRILFDIWKFTHTPLLKDIRSMSSFNLKPEKITDNHKILTKAGIWKKRKYNERIFSEQEIVEIINQDKKIPKNEQYDWFADNRVRYFGSVAVAAIYPPEDASLPNMLIAVYHFDEASAFGEEDFLIFYLQLKKDGIINFYPVALVLDSEKPMQFRQHLFEGTPAENNIMVFKKDEINVRIKGKTLFAGWIKPIPLKHSDFVLPPACILFEGYGKVKSGGFKNTSPVGRNQKIWYNSLDAFVTLFLPSSKYSGSSTEGFLEKETELISEPPINRTGRKKSN